MQHLYNVSKSTFKLNSLRAHPSVKNVRIKVIRATLRNIDFINFRFSSRLRPFQRIEKLRKCLYVRGRKLRQWNRIECNSALSSSSFDPAQRIRNSVSWCELQSFWWPSTLFTRKLRSPKFSLELILRVIDRRRRCRRRRFRGTRATACAHE